MWRIPRRAGAAPALIAMKHKKPEAVKGRRPKGTLDRHGHFVFFTKIRKISGCALDHQPARATGEAGAHGTPARRRAAGRQCPGTGREGQDPTTRSGAESPLQTAQSWGRQTVRGAGPLPVAPTSEGGNAGAGPPGAALALGPGREARTPAQGRRRQATKGSRPCPLEIKTFPHSGPNGEPGPRGEGGARGGRGIPPSARAQAGRLQTKSLAGRHEGGHDQQGAGRQRAPAGKDARNTAQQRAGEPAEQTARAGAGERGRRRAVDVKASKTAAARDGGRRPAQTAAHEARS